MASKKIKKKRTPSPRGDRFTYAEFVRDLIAGTIHATTLYDVTEANGSVEITVTTEDENGLPVQRTITHPLKRLVTVDYDELEP